MNQRVAVPLVVRRSPSSWLAVLIWLVAPCALAAEPIIQFNRDIRPILSDNCFQCHGPDAAQRQADLRLDIEDSAKRDLNGVRPITPGQLDQSAIHRRITSTNPDEQMPPPASGKKLTAARIALLDRWITEGSRWDKHWSFLPPRRPPLPAVQNSAWPRNAIDSFILARLEAEGLAPSPEADKTTLLRRVTLDLTGLPPTPSEVDAFLADDSPLAYERAVDRLLASPRYGEGKASRWLDAARYADTSGYQTDGVRHMWRWRDWVIDAFNRNLPFDQFTIEQLAGDLLPGATLDQKIATGFNRNHRGNSEGGIIPEEYAVEYVVDRVDTTATVWLGLTMGCARCHDHKFDPLTQREFYQLFAFFNNVPEKGRALKLGNSPPLVPAPTRDQQLQLRALDDQLAQARAAFAAVASDLAAAETQWAASFSAAEPITWNPSDALAGHLPLDDRDQEVLSGTTRPSDGPIRHVTGQIGGAAAFDGTAAIDAGEIGNFGYLDKFTLAAWVFSNRENGTLLARMPEQPDAEGYSMQLAGGKLQVNLIKRWLDDAIRVETAEPLALDRWQHVAVTYDGSRTAAGVQIFVDGQLRATRILLDELNQTFASPEPLRIGGGGAGPRLQGLVDDVRVYKTNLAADVVALLAVSDSIDAIVATAPAERSPAQAAKLRAYYLERHAPASIRLASERIAALSKERLAMTEGFPDTMVMEELPAPRETFVLARGQYDKPGEKVTAAIPGWLNSSDSLPAGAPTNRLALARWLVDPANPLVSRVAVNRLWQFYFGTGIVKTVDDFGAQGDAPSHPELLDWLACEFVTLGWDMKALERAIVTSATYRQSSKLSPQLAERDPENRLLARGPRFRLPAEVIRDQALAASGLIVEQQGGPSVVPYQPAGLWKELTGTSDFTQDHGASLYRRSLYTFWKRTIAPPSMMTFDAAARDACTVRTTRTNTPLQALALLNEVTYVEAARALAERAAAAGDSPTARIAAAFRWAVGRAPSERELSILSKTFQRASEQFRHDPAAAEKLLHVGEKPLESRLEPAELAAYTAVANLILNLDEVVTKE